MPLDQLRIQIRNLVESVKSTLEKEWEGDFRKYLSPYPFVGSKIDSRDLRKIARTADLGDHSDLTSVATCVLLAIQEVRSHLRFPSHQEQGVVTELAAKTNAPTDEELIDFAAQLSKERPNSILYRCLINEDSHLFDVFTAYFAIRRYNSDPLEKYAQDPAIPYFWQAFGQRVLQIHVSDEVGRLLTTLKKKVDGFPSFDHETRKFTDHICLSLANGSCVCQEVLRKNVLSIQKCEKRHRLAEYLRNPPYVKVDGKLTQKRLSDFVYGAVVSFAQRSPRGNGVESFKANGIPQGMLYVTFNYFQAKQSQSLKSTDVLFEPAVSENPPATVYNMRKYLIFLDSPSATGESAMWRKIEGQKCEDPCKIFFVSHARNQRLLGQCLRCGKVYKRPKSANAMLSREHLPPQSDRDREGYLHPQSDKDEFDS